VTTPFSRPAAPEPFRAPALARGGPQWAERAAEALVAAGPVAAAFAGWLASRPDLLPEVQRTIFSAAAERLAERLPPMPPGEVAARVEEGFGVPWTSVLAAVDAAPLAVGALDQTHRARRADGVPVLLRVLRPAVADDLEAGLAELAGAERMLAAGGVPAAPALAAFAVWLRREIDPVRLATDQAVLAADAATGGAAAAAEPLSPPATAAAARAGVTLLALPPGRSLAELAPGDPAAGEGAVLAAFALLAQALEARPFASPQEPGAVFVGAEGAVAWSGGVLVRLPPLSVERLARWLEAVAAGSTDLACALLAVEAAVPEEVVEPARRRLRQAVAWRDSGAAHADLATEVGLHLSIAAAEGLAPGPHWIAFGQALGSLAPTLRRLAPGGDPAREALARLSAMRRFEELVGVAAPRDLGRRAGMTAAALAALPQQLDALLADRTRPALRLRLSAAAPQETTRGGGLGWLLPVTAVALLWQPLALSLAAPRPAAEAVAALLILACGLAGLRPRRRKGS
jgi:ubiquinone biosynthesis protein